MAMPDLSDLLGDVYGSDEEPAPAPAVVPSSPAWADDERLDRAFGGWTPGPDAEAPAAERDMFAPPAGGPRLADDLAAALSEAVLAETTDEAETEVEHADDPEPEVTDAPAPAAVAPTALADLEPEPAPIPLPVHKAGWQRSDDDILPTGKTARGGVRLPRAPKLRAGKAPKSKPDDGAPKKARKSLGDLMKMEIGGKKKK
jgi:hypothetical protein